MKESADKKKNKAEFKTKLWYANRESRDDRPTKTKAAIGRGFHNLHKGGRERNSKRDKDHGLGFPFPHLLVVQLQHNDNNE